ncbi:MAG: hypothetical protein WBM17_12335 [Anaerolineales bacterium]
MSKKHGEITAALGKELSSSHELAKLGYAVIYDHGKGGDDEASVTSAWIGDKKKRDNRLTEIDIIVYGMQGHKAKLLIEIEESGDNPKKIIGAAMATLFGEKISSPGQADLPVGRWTTLLVLAKGEGDAHLERTRLIEGKINDLLREEGINKMKIGTVKLVLFQHEDDLKPIIIDMLKKTDD